MKIFISHHVDILFCYFKLVDKILYIHIGVINLSFSILRVRGFPLIILGQRLFEDLVIRISVQSIHLNLTILNKILNDMLEFLIVFSIMSSAIVKLAIGFLIPPPWFNLRYMKLCKIKRTQQVVRNKLF